jgi:hypothetical protein
MTAGDYTPLEGFCRVAPRPTFLIAPRMVPSRSGGQRRSHGRRWTEVIAKRRSCEWVLADRLALLVDWPGPLQRSSLTV